MRCGGSDRVVTACRASVTGKLHASTHSTSFSRRSRRQSFAHAAAQGGARETGKEEISAAELKAVEDREIAAVIRKQEEIGLCAVTDGEFRRAFWNYDFLGALPGVEAISASARSSFEVSIRSR